MARNVQKATEAVQSVPWTPVRSSFSLDCALDNGPQSVLFALRYQMPAQGWVRERAGEISERTQHETTQFSEGFGSSPEQPQFTVRNLPLHRDKLAEGPACRS